MPSRATPVPPPGPVTHAQGRTVKGGREKGGNASPPGDRRVSRRIRPLAPFSPAAQEGLVGGAPAPAFRDAIAIASASASAHRASQPLGHNTLASQRLAAAALPRADYRLPQLPAATALALSIA
eukprot:scaffold8298_cov148-Isochrysis_galbana.AAC.1